MSKIDELWAQAAANPGTEIDIGELVMCDACDEDWTTRSESGGFIFSSMGVCPTCAVEFRARVLEAGEQCYLTTVCPPGQAFADFVRAYRGDNNKIRIGPLPFE